MASWNRDTMQKTGDAETQSNRSQGSNSMDEQSDETCTEKDIVSLLKQISKQQIKVQQQQDKIQQQLKDLQASHEKEQLKTQQQFEKTNNILSEKVSALETTLANLHKPFADCVRRSVYSESLDIQEKLSVMTDTLYNHMLGEMRNMSIEKTDCVNKAGVFDTVKKEVHTACQMSHQSAAEGTTSANDRESWDTDNDDTVNDQDSTDFVGKGKEASKENAKKVFLTSDIETTFKHTLHSELNTFLVNVQKLLLKPINSEDMSFYIAERMKGLLQYERNITTDQLLSVQTAISGDIHARLYKMEMCFKQELSRIESTFEQNKQLMPEVNNMFEEIQKFKKFLSFELPTIITSRLKLVSDSEKKSSIKLDEKNVIELGNTKDIKHSDSQKPNKIRHLEKEKHSESESEEIQSESDQKSEEKGDHHTNFDSLNICSEQVQTIMLMFSMYIIMFLVYRDTMSCMRTPLSSSTCEKQTKLKKKKKKTAPLESAKHSEGAGHVLGSQQKADSKHLTDAHLKLMFGQYKVAQYLCQMNHSKLSGEEDAFFQLQDIAPGYNLQLKANMLKNAGNLNFFIMSVCGKQDESLVWPATFTITIVLEDKQPLAGSKKDNWQTFTKTKLLYRPIKSTGHSTPIPLCYFRDDVVNKCIHEGYLHLTISVRYIEERQKDTE